MDVEIEDEEVDRVEEVVGSRKLYTSRFESGLGLYMQKLQASYFTFINHHARNAIQYHHRSTFETHL